MKIYNLENCEYSWKHGHYGGLSGDKDGILINGEPFFFLKNVCRIETICIFMHKNTSQGNNVGIQNVKVTFW